MARYDAIIVGGGHNGLITAAYLVRNGLKTLVIERRDILGGACVTEEITGAPGYRVSTGAAQLGNLRSDIITDLALHDFGFETLLPDPLTVFPCADGRYLALWQDSERTIAEISGFSEHDAKAFIAFRKECLDFCDLIEPALYAERVPSLDELSDLFKKADRLDLFEDFVIGSVWDLLQARFENDAVMGVAGLPATFGTNAGPKAPGTAYVMAHHMFGGIDGVRGRTGYVRGGMGGLAEALAASARQYGAEFRLGCEVARIVVEQASVRGVELATGERIDAPIVVSNADPQRTFLGMIDRGVLSPGFAEAVENIEMQGVALKVNCALERLPAFTALPPNVQAARVSICPSLEYVETAWQQAEKGLLSTAPFMTVHMQSAIDGSLAPQGRQTLTCYAQYFPYNLDPALQGWDEVRQRAGEIVLDTVAAYAPDLRSVILHTEVLSPLDLEDRFAMSGGHQFHGDLMPGQLFDNRPVPGCSGAETPIDGLFLCGAGTHPGGCVWGAPGQRAARRILADRGVC